MRIMTLISLANRPLSALTLSKVKSLAIASAISLCSILSVGAANAATDNHKAKVSEQRLTDPVVIDSQQFSGGFGINEIDTGGVLKNAPPTVNTDFLNGSGGLENNFFYAGAPALVNTLPFYLDADLDGGDVVFTISMRNKSYVYKSSILINGNKDQVRFSDPIMPEAVIHKDALGTSEVYFDRVDIRVPLIKATSGAVLDFNYQGCDESGICYPPQRFTFVIKKTMSEDQVLLAREEASKAAKAKDEAKALATKASENTTTDSEANVAAIMSENDMDKMHEAPLDQDYPPNGIEPTVAVGSALLSNLSRHASEYNKSSNEDVYNFKTEEMYSTEDLNKIGVTSVEELSKYATGNYNFEGETTSTDADDKDEDELSDSDSATTSSEQTVTKSFNPPAQKRSVMDYMIDTEGKSDAISALLTENLLIGLLLCFALGIGLDLTPCVLPMLPIFSAMIIGPNGNRRPMDPSSPHQKKANVDLDLLSRAERLKHLAWQNFGYAMGLSLTYTVLGVAFSLLGAQLHGLLQSPVLTALIAILLLICAAACAGWFELKLPQGFTNKLQSKISVLNTRSFSGAFLLGLLSALIASPCTSAPLAGALLYVMQSGNLMIGALVFFAIGLGMAAPLFIIGVFGSKFLQHSGIAGEVIKRVMAIILVVTAYVITRHMMGRSESLFAAATIFICSAYALSTILYIIVRKKMAVLTTSISCIAAAALTFMSLPYIQKNNDHNTYSEFYGASSKSSLKNVTANNKSYVVFTAEWCTNCKYMEKTIYSQKPFLDATSSIRRVVINITDAADPSIKELVDKYHVVGVPFFVTLDKTGKVVDSGLGLATQEQVLKAVENLNKLP